MDRAARRPPAAVRGVRTPSRQTAASRPRLGASPALVGPVHRVPGEVVGLAPLFLRHRLVCEEGVEAARDLGVAARPHGQTKDSSDEAAARLSPRARSPIDLVEDLCRDGNRGLAMGHGTPLGNTKESTLARRRSTDKSAASRLRVARPLTCAAPGPAGRKRTLLLDPRAR